MADLFDLGSLPDAVPNHAGLVLPLVDGPREWRVRLRFEVIGTPQQRGSKRPVRRGKAGTILLIDDNKMSRDWMDRVACSAHAAWQGQPLLDEPLALSIIFYFHRPKSHFRTGKNAHLLRDSAPRDCLTSRDLAKLIRSTEDACTAVVWRDDKLVCHYLQPMGREYTEGSEMALVTVYSR